MKNLKGKSRDRHTGEGRYPELDKIAEFRVKPGMTKGGRYALLRVRDLCTTPLFVTPAKAGVQKVLKRLDTGFRRYDDLPRFRRNSKVSVHQQGFTLIELLIVVSIIGIMMTVSLPISINMYYRYKASLQAQEVMVAISDLRRESFLYSENKVLSSDKNVLTVNGVAKNFAATSIRIDVPIQFYKNGTTSGGVINLIVSEYAYSIEIKAPFGDLALEGGLRAT